MQLSHLPFAWLKTIRLFSEVGESEGSIVRKQLIVKPDAAGRQFMTMSVRSPKYPFPRSLG
ncbi:MAG: hypothetical protein KME31_12685 [Tolypothrix carrinoi HA7290-LM1]|jgi:hypothetical protein|nr:hypothetical protein [Tolypothrix carrinoi HA7290-LM1]